MPSAEAKSVGAAEGFSSALLSFAADEAAAASASFATALSSTSAAYGSYSGPLGTKPKTRRAASSENRSVSGESAARFDDDSPIENESAEAVLAVDPEAG